MARIFRASIFALTLILAFTGTGSALAQIDSYSALLEAVSQASDDDILIISGTIEAQASDPPLRSDASLIIRGVENNPAELIGLRIDSMNVGFSNVQFSNGLDIQGDSHVRLMSGTRAQGASGLSAITMTGSGTLQIDRDSVVVGGANAGSQGGDGIVLSAHSGGLQVVIEGDVSGGEGRTGGNALTLSGLNDHSSADISGTLCGGEGSHTGGNAINLYDFSDAASVSLSGLITGGSGGRTGGNAIQIVNVSDNAAVELSGRARGGDGASFGGDTVIAMNVTGSLVLTGQFRGGDVSSTGERPGAAVLLLDAQTTENTTLAGAQLEDGQVLPPSATPEPSPEPTPDSTPEQLTPALSPEPTPELTPEPTREPTDAPSAEPDDEVVATPDEAAVDSSDDASSAIHA